MAGPKDEGKVKEEKMDEEMENEYMTQAVEKVEKEDKLERDARILDFVARKVAGQEAIMAWREINLSQAPQVLALPKIVFLTDVESSS